MKTTALGKSVYLFCCLVFFVVWAFRVLFFLLFGRGRVFFFAVWAGAQAPPKQQKQKTTPPPKQQKKNTPPPLPSVCVLFAVWAGGCVYFLLFGRGACCLFCCLGRWRVFLFAVWAGACSFFAVWVGACSFSCCLGRGRVFFFFAVWAGDGSSLTYPSAWLVFKRPNNKRDRTAKQKTRVPTALTRGVTHQENMISIKKQVTLKKRKTLNHLRMVSKTHL